MSGLVTGWVLKHSPAAGAARMVLVVLADHADSSGRQAWPSVSTIAAEANCSPSTVHKVLRELEEKGQIEREGTSEHRTVKYRIVMADPSEDRTPPEIGPSDPSTADPPEIGPEPSLRQPSVEANASTSPIPFRPDVRRICTLLADLIAENDPKATVSADSKGWRDAARLLLDKDGREQAEIEMVIRFSQTDEFWRSNVLSMPTLRKQYTRLLLRMRTPNGSSRQPSATDFLAIARGEA